MAAERKRSQSETGTGSVSPVPASGPVPRTGVSGGFEVETWGLDTVAFALRADDLLAWNGLTAAVDTRKVWHHALPGARLPVTVYSSGNWNADCDFARVFGYPRVGLLKVDCRLAALLGENDATQALAHPTSLRDGETAAEALVSRLLGITGVEFETRIQRADLTVDVRFESRGQGCEFVWACSHLTLPRYDTKAHPTKDPQVLKGVEWKTGSNHTHARIYDKGLQRRQKKLEGAEPAGSLIRLERQMTFGKSKQPDPSALAKSDLRRAFLGAFAPLVETTEGMTICGQLAAAELVQTAHAARRISYAAARRLQGDLFAEQAYGSRGFPNEDARKRSERELRKLGILFERALLPTIRVEVAPVFKAAAAKWPVS